MSRQTGGYPSSDEPLTTMPTAPAGPADGPVDTRGRSSRTWMGIALSEADWSEWDSDDHLAQAQELVKAVAQDQIDNPTYLRTITPPEMTLAALHVQVALVKRQR